MNKNILVTGGLGYIGSHTVVALQNEGFHVVIIDDLSNSSLDALENITKITGKKPDFHCIDLKDFQVLESFFKTQNISGIIHFAAYKAVGESVEKPLMYYRNNLLGLINLLELIQKFNCNNFIFSSSCTVYGQAEKMPINEQTPLKTPESPYGKTKQMGEEIISDFVSSANKKANALRYFNPVGAHPSSIIGEIPSGIPNNLLPFITQTAAGIRQKLSVFGDDYSTPDGTAIRDYIDVNDLAQAHVKALYRLLEDKNQTALEFFNLGSGTGSSVLQIVEAFEKATSIKIPYAIEPRRAGDIQEAFADYTKANKLLGWQPETSLEESLKNAWNFQKNQ